MLHRRIRLVGFPLLLIGLLAPASRSQEAGIAGYLSRPDKTYGWKLEQEIETPEGKIEMISLTSQTWRGIAWKHGLRIYEPKDVAYPDSALLFITGGSTRSQADDDDHKMGFTMAKLCGARVAVLPQVPNQPLYDGKVEDDLISHTFVEYLESGDSDWPLLQPMVKSAMAAMTAVQERGKQKGQPVERFVVTGASKRGWTTWLTGELDDRVVGIAPMVIPTLNMKAQSEYQMTSWGKYSEQIDDYVRRGLMQQFDTPRGQVLWKLVDPFTYLDKLDIPVLQINGTNDPYWTLDSMNLYWDDIKVPKYVVYLPNAGHGLDQNRDYALGTLGAFFRHVVSGRPMPKLTWSYEAGPEAVYLKLSTDLNPKVINIWTAESETKDFRGSKWEKVVATNSASEATHEVKRSNPKYRAVLGDVAYEIDGVEYHLSTQIEIVDPKAH